MNNRRMTRAALVLLFMPCLVGANEWQHRYLARITSVYDGDTVTADIDLGLNTVRMAEKLRLYGIDAPEMRGEERQEGIISRDWLRWRIMGKDVEVRTERDARGKYGRLLSTIYIDGVSVNAELVDAGLAEYAEY